MKKALTCGYANKKQTLLHAYRYRSKLIEEIFPTHHPFEKIKKLFKFVILAMLTILMER